MLIKETEQELCDITLVSVRLPIPPNKTFASSRSSRKAKTFDKSAVSL